MYTKFEGCTHGMHAFVSWVQIRVQATRGPATTFDLFTIRELKAYGTLQTLRTA